MRVTCLTLLACLALAAPAHAEPPTDRPLTGPRYTASLIAATEFWHASPPCAIKFYAATDRELTDWIGGSPAAAVRAVQRGDECPIWLAPEWRAPGIENRVMTCTLATHEDGHLLGYGHVQDDRSIMWPVLSRVTWPCFHRFVPRGNREAWIDGFSGEWATRPG